MALLRRVLVQLGLQRERGLARRRLPCLQPQVLRLRPHVVVLLLVLRVLLQLWRRVAQALRRGAGH